MSPETIIAQLEQINAWRRGEESEPQQSGVPARDLQTLCDLGDSKAGESIAALESWGATLTAEEKRTIGAARWNAWKARAS